MSQSVEDSIVKRCFATIYTPSRRRKRFPENCVRVVGSATEAISQASATENTYPAEVMGPSRSSEGFRLYYLIEWLD